MLHLNASHVYTATGLWIKLHYLDDHAHANWQERVYLYTLSCLGNTGKRRQNLVWGYTRTLPPFVRQERV